MDVASSICCLFALVSVVLWVLACFACRSLRRGHPLRQRSSACECCTSCIVGNTISGYAVYGTLPVCGGGRPYGTASLLAVYDDDGPQLYLIEPSGAGHVRPAASRIWQFTLGNTLLPWVCMHIVARQRHAGGLMCQYHLDPAVQHLRSSTDKELSSHADQGLCYARRLR